MKAGNDMGAVDTNVRAQLGTVGMQCTNGQEGSCLAPSSCRGRYHAEIVGGHVLVSYDDKV